MSNPDSLANAVKDAHTVFLVTDFWATLDDSIEIAQGKAVTDACKKANVNHLIFSSLINTTKATEGRLAKISHFVGKAKIEDYIRQSGIPVVNFYLPGMFMSGFVGFIQKVPADESASGGDGKESYVLALPVDGDKAQLPLVDVVADTGRFVKIALKNPEKSGQSLLGSTAYYTPNQLMREFEEAIGRPAKFQQVPADVFKTFMPKGAEEELCENMLLTQDVGYYAGAKLEETLAAAEGKPKSWKDFVVENKEKWLQK